MANKLWRLIDTVPHSIAQAPDAVPAESQKSYWGPVPLAFNDAQAASLPDRVADATANIVITSAAQASEAIAGASAGSFAVTSAATAQLAEAAAAAGSFTVTSASTAAAAIAASAAGSFGLTASAAATAGEAAAAVGLFSIVSGADASNPEVANVAGGFSLVCASDAQAYTQANAVGVIVMVGGFEEPAIPDAPTVTGIIWGYWQFARERWERRRERIRAERIHPTRYAVGIAEIRIVGSATATVDPAPRVADAHADIRIVGNATATVGVNSADDEEALLLGLLLERMAA